MSPLPAASLFHAIGHDCRNTRKFFKCTIILHGDNPNLSVAAAVRPASQLAFSAARHQAANMWAHHRVLSHCGCDSLARLAFEIKGVQEANSYLTKSFGRQTTRNCRVFHLSLGFGNFDESNLATASICLEGQRGSQNASFRAIICTTQSCSGCLAEQPARPPLILSCSVLPSHRRVSASNGSRWQTAKDAISSRSCRDTLEKPGVTSALGCELIS